MNEPKRTIEPAALKVITDRLELLLEQERSAVAARGQVVVPPPLLELLNLTHALAYQCERIATRNAEIIQRCAELEQSIKEAPPRRATDTRSAAWWATYNAALMGLLCAGELAGVNVVEWLAAAGMNACKAADQAHGVRHG